MTDLMHSPFGQFLLVLILGLVPAYVLGRFLPSKAMVKGPFQGLSVSFTGSFALYLFILLAGGAFISGVRATAPTYQPVSISAQLRLDGAVQEELRQHQVRVVLFPVRDSVSPPSSNAFNVSVGDRGEAHRRQRLRLDAAGDHLRVSGVPVAQRRASAG